MAVAFGSTSEGPVSYGGEGGSPVTGELEGSAGLTGGEGSRVRWKAMWQGMVDEHSVCLFMDEMMKDKVRWEVLNGDSAVSYAAIIDHAGLVTANLDPRMNVSELCDQMVSLCSNGGIQLIHQSEGDSGLLVKLSETIRMKQLDYLFHLKKQQWSDKDQQLWALRKENDRLKSRIRQLEEIVDEQKETITRLTRISGEDETKEELKGYSITMEASAPTIASKTVGEGVMLGSSQFIEEYVRKVVTQEKLTMSDQSSIDRLFNAKIDLWKTLPERNQEGIPMFLVKMRTYVGSKDPWDLIFAQFMYLNRREVKADDTDERGNNALQLTVQYLTLSSMFEWLVKDGHIDPASPNKEGATALHLAAQWNSFKCAKLLLSDERVNKDAIDMHGDTPLMYAVKNEHTSMVLFLLGQGCDKEITNQEGKSAYSLAKKQKNRGMVQLLKDTKSKKSRGFRLF